VATDDVPPVARHVQDLTPADAALTVEYGLAAGLGLSLSAFYREVRTRVRFEDAAGQPVVLPQGDIHHRNETLTGPADAWAMVTAGRSAGPWSVGGRAGVTVPLGRTVENPFALGRRGLAHEHIQFGTGTWDPLAGVSVGRRLGKTLVLASTLARVAVTENEHGYRAGNRYEGTLSAGRALGGRWRGQAALALAHESAERWSGVIEEEGNLGRTDLLASAVLARALGAGGTATLAVSVPLSTHARGAQVRYPAIVSLGWSR